MGNFKYLMGGAIAALGIAAIAAAQADVVAVPTDHGYLSPGTGVNGAEAQKPSSAAAASFAFNDPIGSENNDPLGAGADDIKRIEANGSPSDFSVGLPEASTWAMMGLWFAIVALTAFRSKRKRPPRISFDAEQERPPSADLSRRKPQFLQL